MNELFKDRLISLREAKGLSQKELAALSGMAPTQLARYECGKAVPRRAATARLAIALSVDPAFLVNGKLNDSSKQQATSLGGRLVHLDQVTNKVLEEKARILGVNPDEALKTIVFESVVSSQESVLAKFSERDLQILALEVKRLLSKE